MKKAIILGAGITGLRIAKYLLDSGFNVKIIEKTSKVGGMTASFNYKDFILDYGPHKFYTQLSGVNEDFKNIVGKDNYLTVKKKNSIRLLGQYFDFPAKISQLLIKIPPTTSLGILFSLAKAKLNRIKPRTYSEYFINGFGKIGYGLIFKGFAEKVWGDPTNLDVELAIKRSPAKSIVDVLKTIVKKESADVSASSFYYPKKGYGIICENLAKSILEKKGEILLEAKLIKINAGKDNKKSVEVIFNNHKKILSCDVLVSSIAINELCDLIPAPEEIRVSASKLKFRSLVIGFVFLKKSRALRDNWIFFPEKEFCFNRVAELKSFSEYVSPKNRTVLTAELSCDYGDELFNSSEEEIKRKVISDLDKADLIKSEEVYDFIVRKAGRVYPVYYLNYQKDLKKVLEYLDSVGGVYTAGRLGLFNYNNADHCLDMARVISEIIIKNKGLDAWKQAREYFNKYRIVD